VEERRFDNLTKALAGSVGRRAVIKSLAAAAFGSMVPVASAEAATAGGNNACDIWCHANFSGSAAGSCTSAAAKRSGPCYQCGPASPNGGQGQAVCNGKCTSVTTTANCGACGHACTCEAHGTATCVNGQCGVTCDRGYCASGGACYPAGAVNPANHCQTCQSVKGVAGWVTKTCAAGDQCHGAGQCDPATGQCTNPDLPDGTSCNDNNSCTGGDTCQAGVCTGGAAVACAPSGVCYTATCDPVKGCQNTPKPAGTPCSDNNSCTIGDACDGNGTCVPGQQLSCPPCHTCDQASGTCVADPAQAGHACPGNGDLCFGAFTCDQGGNCAGVNPVTCAALDQCHIPGTCNPATGLCSNPNGPDDFPCTEGDPCSTCQAGVCTPLNCDDGIDCTIDTCVPGLGCVHTPEVGICTSTGPCFIPKCDPVQGCIQVPKDCDDHNPCTIDSCFGGVCSNVLDTTLCNDGLKCTTDTCVPQVDAQGNPSPDTYTCKYVFEPSNCGKLASCQTALCSATEDCAVVFNDDLCPPYPNGVTCLVPECGAAGCGYRDICGAAVPECGGCADCSCNIALGRCVPTCPS
jgi:hypothetical protein